MGTSERRQRDKERRRNDILDAAESIFFTKGIESATMDQVADEAELSKGTLYLYFKSKQELYEGIHQRGFQILEKLFADAVQEKKTGLEKIKAIGYAYYQFSRDYPNYYYALMYFEHSHFDSPAIDNCNEKLQDSGFGLMQFVQDTIESGIKDGSINPQIDAEKMAFILWGQTSGIIQIIAKVIHHKNFNRTFNPLELFEEFMNNVGQILALKKRVL